MSDNVRSFFEALAASGSEGAFAYLSDVSFPDGRDQEPSPRAKEVVENGEWNAKKLVRLLYVTGDDVCWGLLPASSATEGGPAYVRFCTLQGCTTNSHVKHKVPQDHRLDGWYLEAGGQSRGGACLDFRFPIGPEGPVVQSAVKHLVGDNPHRMTFGQWRFLFDEYATRDVISLSEAGSGETPSEPTSSGLRLEEAVEETKEGPLESTAQSDASRSRLRVKTIGIFEEEDGDDDFESDEKNHDSDSPMPTPLGTTDGASDPATRALMEDLRSSILNDLQLRFVRYSAGVDSILDQYASQMKKHSENILA